MSRFIEAILRSAWFRSLQMPSDPLRNAFCCCPVWIDLVPDGALRDVWAPEGFHHPGFKVTSHMFEGPREPREELVAGFAAISLFHCRNVKLVTAHRPRKLETKLRKRYSITIPTFHVIEVHRSRRIAEPARIASGSREIGGHFVRGHFKHYPEGTDGIVWESARVCGFGKLTSPARAYREKPTIGFGARPEITLRNALSIRKRGTHDTMRGNFRAPAGHVPILRLHRTQPPVQGGIRFRRSPMKNEEKLTVVRNGRGPIDRRPDMLPKSPNNPKWTWGLSPYEFTRLWREFIRDLATKLYGENGITSARVTNSPADREPAPPLARVSE